MYKKIGDFFLLEEEADKHMVAHASNPESWHEYFVTHLETEYLQDRKCRTVLDIGASYGWMALGFAKIFKQVHTFDIRSDVVAAQRINLRSYDNVIIHEYGLGAESKTGVAFGKTNSSGTTSLRKNKTNKEECFTDIKTIDELGFNDVDLVKIDTEGFEMKVLLGGYHTIRDCRPILVVECGTGRSRNSFLNRRRVIDFTRELNYRLVDVRYKDFIFLPE